MRRMLERLADRHLVRGKGRGADREWWLTAAGRKAIGDRAPAKIPEPSDRAYTVLQQKTLLAQFRETLDLNRAFDLGLSSEDVAALERLIVFVPLADKDGKPLEVVARNTEDAYRRVLRDYGLKITEEEPVLIAVADRYWQPVPITVSTRQHISIG